MKYLLDTNICIYFMKGMYSLDEKIKAVDVKNCFISEITLAELKYGVENSFHKRKNAKVLEAFMSEIKVLPIFNSLDFYAKEKARLRKSGEIIDDFDLLIGASAVVNKMVLVTNNQKHFKRIKQVRIQDWTRN